MENFNFIESMIEAGVQTTNLMEQSHVPSVSSGQMMPFPSFRIKITDLPIRDASEVSFLSPLALRQGT